MCFCKCLSKNIFTFKMFEIILVVSRTREKAENVHMLYYVAEEATTHKNR